LLLVSSAYVDNVGLQEPEQVHYDYKIGQSYNLTTDQTNAIIQAAKNASLHIIASGFGQGYNVNGSYSYSYVDTVPFCLVVYSHSKFTQNPGEWSVNGLVVLLFMVLFYVLKVNGKVNTMIIV
jgi:hypothetical protein